MSIATIIGKALKTKPLPKSARCDYKPCSKRFKPKKHWQKYCKPAHRNAAFEDRQAEKLRAQIANDIMEQMGKEKTGAAGE